MTDEVLDPKREEEDPGYLEDAAAQEEPVDQRKPYVHDPEVHGRDFRVEGNDVRDYVGVDPEYRTYANEYDAPILTDTERFHMTDQYDHLEGNIDEDEESDGAYVLTDEQRRILREAGQPVEGDVIAEDVPEGASEAKKPAGPVEPEGTKTNEQAPAPLFPAL